jgi:hypothetical protein
MWIAMKDRQDGPSFGRVMERVEAIWNEGSIDGICVTTEHVETLRLHMEYGTVAVDTWNSNKHNGIMIFIKKLMYL